VTGAVLSGALVALYFLRRRRSLSKERPVNILQDDEDRVEQNHNLPQHYAPEPFLFPHPTVGGMSEATSTHDRLLSMTSADIQGLQTPTTATTTSSRKSALPPQLRSSVNIIQHDDAGPSEGLSGHSQFVTVELPPAYTNLLQPQRASLATSAPTSTTALTIANGDS
jgi:hypothetical protein